MVKYYTTRQYLQDLKIVGAIEKEQIRLFDYFNDVDKKRDILRGIGYRRLRTASDKSEEPFTPLENCKDERISAVLLRRYDTAIRRLEEDFLKKMVPGKSVRNIPVEEILSKRVEIPIRIVKTSKDLGEQLTLF